MPALRIPRSLAPTLRSVAALFALSIIPATTFALPYTVNGRYNYTVGSGPRECTLADVNNDGKVDILCANFTSNTISVLLGNGTTTFQAAHDYAAGTGPYSLRAVDLNGDGNTDVIVADNTSNVVSVLLGDGTGAFYSRTEYACGANPTCVRLGNFNLDGSLDLVTSNSGANTVTVLFGNGAGAFTGRQDIPAGANPSWVSVGDLNRDRNQDLVVTNSTANTVSVLLGDGAGSFGSPVSSAVGTEPVMETVADVNNDGMLDVVTANRSANSLSVLLGNGAGGFSSRTDVPTGTQPVSVDAGDLNFDGNLDLAVGRDGGVIPVSLYVGNGAGAFGLQGNYSAGLLVRSVLVRDVNGDGKPDVLVSSFDSNTLTLLTGKVPGGFALGDTLVQATARDQNGATRSMSQFKGKWFVYDMCTAWCGPCKMMANDVTRVYGAWANAGTLPFEYVSGLYENTTHTPTNQNDAAVWASAHGISRPVLHESDRYLGPTSLAEVGAKLKAVPTWMIVDPIGRIRRLEAGYVFPETLVAYIAALAGVPIPTLPAPTPPGPAWTARPIWQAPLSGSATWHYGAAAVNILLTGYTTTPDLTGSDVRADGVAGVPGSSGPGTVEVQCTVDSTRDVQSLVIFLGTPTGQDTLLTNQPFAIDLTLNWPDGKPRQLSSTSVAVSVLSGDVAAPTETLLPSTTVSLNGNKLSIGAIPLGGVPLKRWGVAFTGVTMRHAPNTLAVPDMPHTVAVSLASPFPNPVRAQATLRWAIASAGKVDLQILDLAGRRVRHLHDGVAAAGSHTSMWDLRDESGQRVAPGLYFVRLSAAGSPARSARLVIIE